MDAMIMGYVGFRRDGTENGNYCNGFYRDYYKDPFLSKPYIPNYKDPFLHS